MSPAEVVQTAVAACWVKTANPADGCCHDRYDESVLVVTKVLVQLKFGWGVSSRKAMVTMVTNLVGLEPD